MIVTITEPKEYSDEEVYGFLFHNVGLELPFEQIENYFEVEDLPKVRKMWIDAEEDLKLDKAWSRPLYDKDDEDFMWWDRY